MKHVRLQSNIPAYLHLIQRNHHLRLLEQKAVEVWFGVRSVHDVIGHAVQMHTMKPALTVIIIIIIIIIIIMEIQYVSSMFIEL